MRRTLLHHRVELPNGLRLPYAEDGEPDGLPVLLLHGYTDSGRAFEPLMAHLPPGLRAIAPTLRGHGDADRPPRAGYGPAEMAADIAALMARLRLPPAVVLGHSMGSQVAQRLAIDHPARVRGLVLIGGFTTLGGNSVIDALAGAVAGLADPVDPGFARDFQESTLARPVPAAFLDMVVAESLKPPARVWRAALAAQRAADVGPALGRIAVPTLLLWGERDSVVPLAMQQALLRGIPGAELKVLADAGHAPHWEDPAGIAATIAGFIAAELGASAPAPMPAATAAW